MAITRIDHLQVNRLDVQNTVVSGGTTFVDLANAATDEKAKVSSNDTTPGFLNGKLVAGTNVTLTENNNGGDETLTISATAPVTSVNTQTGAVTLTAASVGAAATSHTHAASDVTSGVLATARLASTGTASASTFLRGDQTWSAAPVTSVNTQTGAVTLTAASVGAAATSHTHAASDVTSGVFATARLASSGTASASTFLRGDQTWATVAGGVTGFTPSQNTSSPNTSTNVSRLLVDASTSSADIALQPKGDGAFLAQLPDNTTDGGGKRGGRAVDLQMFRNSSTQVASGSFSTISGGRNNTASSSDSTVGGGSGNTASGDTSGVFCGSGNTASNWRSFVGGGLNNNCAGYLGAIVGGFNNSMNNNGDYKVICGGQINTINSSDSSVIAGGQINTINATCNWSSILGGRYNWISNGFKSIILGGEYNQANAELTIASGSYARARYNGNKAWAQGAFANTGDCQLEEAIVRATTSDATSTALLSMGNTAISIPASSSGLFEILVTANQTNADNTCGFKLNGMVYNLGTAGISGLTTTKFGDAAGNTTWSATVTMSGTNMVINVVGEAGKTIRWGGHVKIMMVGKA